MNALRHFPFRPILCLAAGFSSTPGTGHAEESPPPAHTHVLFMGTDLSLQRDKKLYRVKDVTGSELNIRVNGEEVLVPTRRNAINLHVDADLKVSAVSVQLDELKSGPGYTYGNDPMRQLEEANRNNMAVQDMQDTANAAVPRNEANLAAVKENVSHYDLAAHPELQARGQREIANATALVQDSQRTVDYTTISRTSDSTNVGSGANRMALGQGNFDAMDVSFKVSSPVALDHPYMVILFKFHDPAAKPGVDGLVIHAQAMDPIDEKPRYVRVLRGGLPQGFNYVDSSVHIFNRGTELATNLSDKRVELTRDEARLYLVMAHRSANKGATVPAAAVSGTLSYARRESRTPSQLTRNFFAKVDSDGALVGVFKDADCQVPLEDKGIKGALDEVFFTPALAEGKPAEGVAKVRLSDI